MGKVLICFLIFRIPDYCQSYQRAATNSVFDESRIIDPARFTVGELLRSFQDFRTSRCNAYPLARLIVATSKEDLLLGTNTVHPEILGGNPAATFAKWYLSADISRTRLAQVWCFDGRATSWIRSEDKIQRYELSGGKDSREITILGTNLKIVGFLLRLIDLPPRHGDKREPNPLVSIFATTDVLPSLEIAKNIKKELERETRAEVILVIRTDSVFFVFDGPAQDLFAIPLKRISETKFLSQPSVVCTSQECRLVRNE